VKEVRLKDLHDQSHINRWHTGAPYHSSSANQTTQPANQRKPVSVTPIIMTAEIEKNLKEKKVGK